MLIAGVVSLVQLFSIGPIGGLFEGVLGFFLKPLRKFFPAVVTGTVVMSIGLSLISVGINSYNKVTVIGTAASRVYFHLKAEAVRMGE